MYQFKYKSILFIQNMQHFEIDFRYHYIRKVWKRSKQLLHL